MLKEGVERDWKNVNTMLLQDHDILATFHWHCFKIQCLLILNLDKELLESTWDGMQFPGNAAGCRPESLLFV